MSRHRRPSPAPRPTVRIAVVGASAVVLTVASLVGAANQLGNDWTPAAQTTPALPEPADDDPRQFGRRGLPVPARIFPSDLNAPDYAIGDGDAAAEVPTVALSAPSRACRCSPRVSVPPQTVAGLSAGPLAEVTTAPTPTETVTEAAETTAAPTPEPTATEPVDQPEETPVTEEPEVTVPPVEPICADCQPEPGGGFTCDPALPNCPVTAEQVPS